MSSALLFLINDIKNDLLLSLGITYIVLGTVGNLLNIILFRKRVLWKLSPCIPFLLVASVANMIDIYSAIMLRMLIGFQITPAYYSPIICKLQYYLYYTSYCISSWCMVACCADRFISSSHSAAVRRYSSMRMSGRIILGIILFTLLVYLQTLFCYEANQFNKPTPCFVQTAVCSVVDIVLYFIFQAIGPPLLMFIFGIGTFIHIHQRRSIAQISASTTETAVRTNTSVPTRNTERNGREILRMLTIQVVLYIVFCMPLLALKIYFILPLSIVKSTVRISVENLIFNAALLISFIDKSFSFYIYTLASKYYRQELIKLMTRCWSQRRVVPQN